jgi:glutaconate CoA-transferase subunit B
MVGSGAICGLRPGPRVTAASDSPVTDFLVRASREFLRGGWIFTGFHWPVLAGQLAHNLSGANFTQVFEAGVSAHGAGRLVPTSTTDYSAYQNAFGYLADTAGALLAMGRRYDRVVLDASNIDLRGRVNSSYLGPRERPTVRLPGGGGAADVAAVARELIWLHGGSELSRIQGKVEHVTAAPGIGATVRLHTRWGSVRLGARPALEEVAEVPDTDEFVAHLESLGASTADAIVREPILDEERAAANRVLRAAAGRGYAVARLASGEAIHVQGKS